MNDKQTFDFYVVLQAPKGDKTNEAHSFPVNFLVVARDEQHALERCADELGKPVLGPMVLTLDDYYHQRKSA